MPSHSEAVLLKLGAADGIDFVFSKDGSQFSPAYFAGFNAVMFFTGGDITSVGDDGYPAVTPEGKQALLDAIAGGMRTASYSARWVSFCDAAVWTKVSAKDLFLPLEAT